MEHYAKVQAFINSHWKDYVLDAEVAQWREHGMQATVIWENEAIVGVCLYRLVNTLSNLPHKLYEHVHDFPAGYIKTILVAGEALNAEVQARLLKPVLAYFTEHGCSACYCVAWKTEVAFLQAADFQKMAQLPSAWKGYCQSINWACPEYVQGCAKLEDGCQCTGAIMVKELKELV